MKKSSFHFLSGDTDLNWYQRGLYRLSAKLEYVTEQHCSVKGVVSSFQPILDEAALIDAFGERVRLSSPSRVLCFDYLLHRCGDILNDERHVLDIGCGYGDYSEFIKNSNGFASYHGVDISERERWADYKGATTRFSVATLGEDKINVDGIDTVFSQSVLEHVENDRAVFNCFTATHSRTVDHIHFVPPTRSFIEHRFHGFRRYGPCTINRLLSSPTIRDVEVIMIGNWLTRETHWERAKKIKRVKAFGDRSKVPLYNHDKSVIANLIDRKDMMIAEQVTDAGFFVLRFKQDIAGSGS